MSKTLAVSSLYSKLRSDHSEPRFLSRAVLPKKPYVDVAGISSMIECLTESDPSVARVKTEQVINHAIMKKLDESGFIERPFGK